MLVWFVPIEDLLALPAEVCIAILADHFRAPLGLLDRKVALGAHSCTQTKVEQV